ncbi:hypothetical protein ANN_18448 [Periplaneta americana]|uniref:Tc1-like transposase DDE domain-containing protein n=1 Tax=Periplaneta americana TaxID=6978 RepID=A0ABQ8SPT1_PERAM|nr:hypothetical protein ANN_18448 [Periplaneta americana]
MAPQYHIAYEADMKKIELVDLVRIRRPSPKYRVDPIFEMYGLPPYHCDLNAIEYIWSIIKRRTANRNVDQRAAEIRNRTIQAVSSVTVDEWKNAMTHVKRLERGSWERDHFMDDEIK